MLGGILSYVNPLDSKINVCRLVQKPIVSGMIVIPLHI